MRKAQFGVAVLLAILGISSCQKAPEPGEEPNASNKVPVPTVMCEIAARVDKPIASITFTPENRKIVSIHPYCGSGPRVAELVAPSSLQPFPNADWNTRKPDAEHYLDTVLGVRSDSNGVVWMLDNGSPKVMPKIVGWNTKTNKLEKIIHLPSPATNRSSLLRDLVVDLKHNCIFITDEDIANGGDGSKGALIVAEIRTGIGRRVLEGDSSTSAEQVPIMLNGSPFKMPGPGGKERLVTIGAHGLAADKDFEWLYYAPLSSKSLYRIKIADLTNSTFTNIDLAAKVERYSSKTVSDGISIDNEGNVYFADTDHKNIRIIPAGSRAYQKYTSHPDLSWPDGLAYSSDGYMYVVDSQIDKSAICNRGRALNKPPYLIFRFKPVAPGRVGY